jgi:hypothetical protein
MINKIIKERRCSMNTAPTRPSNKSQWQGAQEDPKRKQDRIIGPQSQRAQGKGTGDREKGGGVIKEIKTRGKGEETYRRRDNKGQVSPKQYGTT